MFSLLFYDPLMRSPNDLMTLAVEWPACGGRNVSPIEIIWPRRRLPRLRSRYRAEQQRIQLLIYPPELIRDIQAATWEPDRPMR